MAMMAVAAAVLCYYTAWVIVLVREMNSKRQASNVMVCRFNSPLLMRTT